MAAAVRSLRPVARLECSLYLQRARRDSASAFLCHRPFSHGSQHQAVPQQHDGDGSSKTPPATSRNVRRLAKETGVSREAAAAGIAFTRKADTRPGRTYGEGGDHILDPDQLLEEEINAVEPPLDTEPPSQNKGFFAMYEDEEEEADDPPFLADDISSTAHGELEQVRELRELYRAIGWDMPLLWQHRKEFKPPIASEQPLRFRYTTYMGETHPGSRKVVLEFSPANLPDLTKPQQDKMIKILGTRYNPHTATAKISSDRFPMSSQNKRCLLNTLDKLLAEARDGKDMFEDVPFDFRHAKVGEKRRRRRLLQLGFPEDWKLGSEEKVRQLEETRLGKETLERSRTVAGEIVDGTSVIEAATGRGEQARQPISLGARRSRL